MSAPKPPPSPARIAANRANAAKSTGPRTEAGKARSRCNAVTHGLTGQGVALASEDDAAVRARFEALHAEMAPTTELGVHFVERIALMSVRTGRAARQESAALAYRVRHAAEEFDHARRAEAQALMDRLDASPARTRRDLVRMPEGVDLLTDRLLDLRARLNRPAPAWSDEHEANYEACHGRRVGDGTISRGLFLSTSLRSGRLDGLATGDQAVARTVPDPKIWIARTLIAEIDAEVARLAEQRATIDREGIALDRAEAGDRALFDPGREATLARRYEAAATRELLRSLVEFRLAEAAGGPTVEPVEPLKGGDVASRTDRLAGFDGGSSPAGPRDSVAPSTGTGPVATASPASPTTTPPAAVKVGTAVAPKLLIGQGLAASLASFCQAPPGFEPGVGAGSTGAVLPIFAARGPGPVGQNTRRAGLGSR